MKNKSRAYKLLAYIYMPVIFSIIAYLLIFIALKPYWDVAVSSVSIFTVNPNIDIESKEKTPIYDPNAEKAEIKEAEKDYNEADRKWERAKREYWKNTPPCANTSCSLFSENYTNHCSLYNIQEDCKDYTAE